MMNILESLDYYLKDISELIAETRKCIPPEKRQEFVAKVGATLNLFVSDLSKEASSFTNGGWKKIDRKWHNVHKKLIRSTKRLKLLVPKDQRDFEAALMWIVEQGCDDDLQLIRQLKEHPPYITDRIIRLLSEAEYRIRNRISEPSYVRKTYLIKTIDFIAKR